MPTSRSYNDLATGLMLLAIAAIGYWLAADLRIGTAQRMGPGYLPRLMCFVLATLGVLIVVRAFVVSGQRLEAWAVKPLLLISLSLGAFAFGIERVGLFISVVVLVGIASLAAPDKRPVEIVILCLGLAAFASFVFVKLLGLPMPLWPDIANFGPR